MFIEVEHGVDIRALSCIAYAPVPTAFRIHWFGDATQHMIRWAGGVRREGTTPKSCRSPQWRYCFQTWFSEALHHEIVRTFKAYIGEPPQEATKLRRHAVAMSVKRDEHMLKSILNLSVLPNGDWDNHSEVQSYLPPGTPFVEKELAVEVATRMVQALVPATFPLMSKDTFHCVRRCR